MTHLAPATHVTPKPASLLNRSLHLGGAAASAQLYAAYVVGGTIADAATVGLYSAETCAVLLSEQRALTGTVRKAAATLKALKSLPAGERRFLGRIDDTCAAIIAFLESVKQLVANPKDVMATADFGRLRATTLAQVHSLLGATN